MTDRQESRLSMYYSFRDYQEAYTDITGLLPNYTDNMIIFKDTITQIQLMAEQQQISRKGVTENKRQLKESLVVTIADYARKLTAFAKFSNNPILLQEVKFTEGRLRKKADTAVGDYAQIVYNRAQIYLTNLAAYGINALNQTALANSILIYKDTIGKPRLCRIEGAQITRQLKTLFQTADSALANMDTAVEIVRLNQRFFYSGYKNARKVINNRTRRLVLKGLITDAVSGNPVKGATVWFAPEGNDTTVKTTRSVQRLVKKTAEKGGFKIRTLPDGIYMVTIKKVGYADYRESVAVAGPQLTDLHFRLSALYKLPSINSGIDGQLKYGG